MLICINLFSFHGFFTIIFFIGILALLIKLYNFCNRRYNLESLSDEYYDSEDEGFENEVNYESSDDE
jgi:hypothetical protein